MVQRRANLFIRKLRTSVCAAHHLAALALQHAIVDLITNTERSATVAGRRLNEDTLERRVQEYFSVHHRVVGDTACKPQISQACAIVKIVQNVERDFFETQLQTRGDIALAICKRGALRAWWSEHSREFIREHTADHGRALVPRHLDTFSVMAKVIKAQTKLSVLFRANDLAKLVDEAWSALRREPHYLSLVAVMWEAEKLRRGGVDEAR